MCYIVPTNTHIFVLSMRESQEVLGEKITHTSHSPPLSGFPAFPSGNHRGLKDL